MKKWIGFLAALLLAVVTGPVFEDHREPVQPKTRVCLMGSL